MSDKKVFDFANVRTGKQKIAGEFSINGEDFQVRVLKDASIAYLVAAVNGSEDPMRIITKVLDFMERALVPESAKRFEKLVLDPEAGLEIEQVVQIFQHVLGVVAGGDPTGPSKGSSPQPRRTGAASTRVVRTTR